MLAKITAASMGLLLAISGPSALADHRQSSAEYEYAPVVDVDPIVRRVIVRTPVQECWDETKYEVIDDGPGRGRARPAMIAGGVLGGLAGKQLGRGRGKFAAAILGAVVGSAIAQNVAAERDRRPEEVRAYTIERCETHSQFHEEERIDGYRVTYEFLGERYTTETREPPGDFVKLRVSVTPVKS